MSEWFDAAKSGDVAKIDQLLLSHAVTDIDDRQHGQTALFIAASNAHSPVVTRLLAGRADPSVVDNEGHTALMAAADSGSQASVQMLINAGVDINAQDITHKTAFDYAKLARNKDAALELLSHGATPGRERIVLVLGAGFTRAFLPGAPLLLDDYGMEGTLTEKYKNQGYAKSILEDELLRASPHGTGKVNLERLMTRLDGGMPYDESHLAVNQLRSLLDDVKLSFLSKLNEAKTGTFHQTELSALAQQLIRKNATVITFNYDDILDEEMHNAAVMLNTRWSPNRGYGFFCQSSFGLAGMTFGAPYYQEPPATILKIHGSVNWRILPGASDPIQSNDIFHHSRWFSSGTADMDENFGALGTQFQPQPFIVPPVLTKSSLTQQPVLRLLWTEAYDALAQADRVIFVGYSLPITDIASSTLFREAMFMMPNYPNVEVVGWATSDHDKEALRASYQQVFPDLDDGQFRFDGARDWARDFVPAPHP